VDLNHAIEIEATPNKVFDALTLQEGLRGWWTADSIAEPSEGTVAKFGFNNRAVVFYMNVDELKPGKSVKWTCTGEPDEWKETKISWEIRENEDGNSFVRFKHSVWKQLTDFCAQCNSSWGALMHRLKDFTEGRNWGAM